MKTNWQKILVVGFIVLLTACGKKEASPAPEAGAAPATGTAAEVVTADAGSGIDPCSLLTMEQVITVLPEATSGMATQLGGSLIEGVDAYQCAYINAVGDMLTVVLNVAKDQARFDEIKPGSAVHENRKQIDVAQEGWIVASPVDVKIKVVKGYTVFDLEIMASDAAGKEAQLVELARAIATKIE